MKKTILPIMINIYLTSLLMTMGCSRLIYNVTTRCPTNVEKKEQNSYWSRSYCSSYNVYHCIRDERYNLVAICNEPVHIPQGNYPIYLHRSDKISYERCPRHLYQPFPVWSYEISDCEYAKSSCNGIGQIPCGNGNTTTDSTCGCDYQKGYVMNGLTKCCSPSRFEECYCQYHTCDNTLQELDSDFKCINKCIEGYERSSQNICEKTARSEPSRDVSTIFPHIQLPDKRKHVFSMQHNDVMFTVITWSGIGTFAFNVMFILIHGSIRSTWRPFKKKISICIGFIVFVGLFFGICIGFADEQRILTYTFTVIVIILLCTTCYLIHSLSDHEMITDPEVYTEEYDIRSLRLFQAAAKGNLNEMKRLRFEDYIDMNGFDINDRSALHLAACEGQYKVLEYICRHNLCFLEAKDRWNRSAEDDIKWHQKHSADKNYEKTLDIVRKYREKNIKKQRKEQFKERKALELITAARTGDMPTIERLCNSGTDMNLANYSGRTALHAAVENGMENIVNYLLYVCGVSPFVRWSGKRPVDIALAHGNDERKQFVRKLQFYMSGLIKFEPNDNHKDLKHVKDKTSENEMIVRLLNSASRGDIKRMKLLNAWGYKMDVSNYDSQTALHIAVMENQEEIVDFLLRKCNQIHIGTTYKDRWGMTPWEVAKNSGRQSVYYIFLDNSPELAQEEDDTTKTCQLFSAAAEGKLETLKSLQKQNCDMNQRDHSGRTALHLAVLAKRLKAVQFLVKEANVDITIPDRYNRLPIDMIDEKTSTEIKDFMKEIKTGKVCESEDLIKVSAKEDTLLRVMKAAFKGILHQQSEIPRYKYFQMDSCDYHGNTPLHIAAANGKLDDVKYLLDDRKASPFVRNNSQERPIELVEQKITFWEESDMHNPVIKKQFKEIKEEIDKSMNIDNIEEKDTLNEKELNDFEQLFQFHNRIFKGDIVAIRRILKTDSSLVDKPDDDKRTALHIAAAAGHTHLVKFFIDKTAKQNEKDIHGFTPLDEAKKNRHNKIQELLENN